MNKMPGLLVAAALLTAACGATTVSSSPVKSVSNSGNVRVDAGANAGTNVAAGAEDDLGRPNPTIRKGPGGPVPVTQSPAPATNGTQPSTVGHDRCTDGFGTTTGAAPRAGASGKRPPLPACAVQ